jgi:hypothetical protein
MPSEATLDLLQTQLTAVCTDPLWLDDTPLCDEFEALLEDAEADEDAESYYGAAAVVHHLLDRVGEEQAEMDGNAYWLLSLNLAQLEENLLTTATAAADRLHFRTGPDWPLGDVGKSLSPTPQEIGRLRHTIAAGDSLTFFFVEELSSSAAFADGVWSLQIDQWDVTAGEGQLLLRDVVIGRYEDDGTLVESRYLFQGEMEIEEWDERISLSADLSGWSSGNSDDLLAVSFRVVNENGSGSELFGIHYGLDQGVWGGSWLSQPK